MDFRPMGGVRPRARPMTMTHTTPRRDTPPAPPIPQTFGALADAPRWVAWRAHKTPVNPHTGRNASSTDPSTWGTYAQAAERRERDNLAGVGIVLGDGLGGVDLDGCRDPASGALAEWAQDIVDLYGTYAEVSPSGTGVKLFATAAPDSLSASTIPAPADPGRGGKAAGIEVYTSRRYFTVTGDRLEGSRNEIRSCPEAWQRMTDRLAANGQNGTRLGVRENGSRPIGPGQRNRVLASLAGSMRRKGMSQDALAAALVADNAARCDPPLPEAEVHGIARSIARYDPDDPASDRAVVVRLSDVEAETVTWVWPDRIPCGRLTVLDGDPGLGKSTLTLDIAARVTRGTLMPMAENGLGGPRGVLLLTAEDGLADTVRPRLDAAGADVARVAALKGVLDGEGHSRLPTVADVDAIRKAADEVDAALVIIDPLSAYLGGADAHRDADVRQTLADLAELAESTGLAVLAVRHLNKSGTANPLYRGGGSIGIVAAARAAHILARDPDDEGALVLAPTKSNLGPPQSALILRIMPTGDGTCTRVEWLGSTETTAADLLRPPQRRTKAEEAEAFLRHTLSGSPRPSAEIVRMAADRGLSEMTLRRARQTLGLVVAKDGFDGGWTWSLPDHPTSDE